MNNIKHFLYLPLLMILAGCGKNETVGGAFGATSGAILGAAVSGGRNPGAGMAIGGLLGGLVGSSVGRAGDREEENRERETERRLNDAKIARLKEENRRAAEHYTKWCERCQRASQAPRARFCAHCPNSRLIYEKRCPRCHETIPGNSSERYCQNDGTPLEGF